MSSTSFEHVACLVCSEPTAPWMVVPCDWRRPDRLQAYSLRRCQVCGFGQVHPRPSRADVARFYDIKSYYTHSEQPTHLHERPRRFIDRLRIKFAWHHDGGVELEESWFRDRLGSRARICDLGCGSGELLARLALLGYDVTGVEPDSRAREVAIQRGVKVFAGTAEEMPEEVNGERFDCIVMSHVLEHTLDPRLALINAMRLLTKHGILIIETPNNEAKGLQRAGIVWPWLDVPRHLNFFTSQSLQAVCTIQGLRVRELQYRGYTRQFDASWIEMERNILDTFVSKAPHAGWQLDVDRAASSWKLLFATAWSPARVKYDSVRAIADYS